MYACGEARLTMEEAMTLWDSSIYELIYTFCQFCCDLKYSLKTKFSKGTMEKNIEQM